MMAIDPKTVNATRGGLRAVIYARYSDPKQPLRSIKDQIDLCQSYIERQGWAQAGTYDDAAQSGASRMQRPAFLRLLADAEARRFDVVVCEAIDRLGRKLSDVADLYDRLEFHRVELHTTNIGRVTQMHIAIMGMTAQMFLADLRDHTWRGQAGRVRDGLIPGGLAYGYEVVPVEDGAKGAGERRIKQDEADIVRRIFREYAEGKSPRHIARALNAEGVPGPNGAEWSDTTIRGQVDRGTGLLNNTLYVGRLSWNRCSYVKDPRTGKRAARVNRDEQRMFVEVPHLRIIDDELWEKVRARQREVRTEMVDTSEGNPLNGAHRRKYLLSGLLTCGCCGHGYAILGKERYGCSVRRAKGTCTNGRTILRQRIEARVLTGIKEHLLAPEMVAEAVRLFADELARSAQEGKQQQRRIERELASTNRAIAGVLRAIEGGAWSNILRERLAENETRKTALEAELASLGRPTPAIMLQPAAAEAYRAEVANLEAALNDPEFQTEAADVLRGLIDKVVLTPDAAALDGLRVDLHGRIADVLAMTERVAEPAVPKGKQQKAPGTGVRGGVSMSQLSVVAGTCNNAWGLTSGLAALGETSSERGFGKAKFPKRKVESMSGWSSAADFAAAIQQSAERPMDALSELLNDAFLTAALSPSGRT